MHLTPLGWGGWNADHGPCVVTLRGDDIVDLTSRDTPTMTALLERDDLVSYVQMTKGTVLGQLSDLGNGTLTLLSPADMQAIKASGVTFAQSMVERVIEERAAGDADLAQEIRNRVTAVIGDSLSGIEPGSPKAMQVKAALQAEGMWSQYLEVGIGPTPRCLPNANLWHRWAMALDVGIHPMSNWNNLNLKSCWPSTAVGPLLAQPWAMT